MSDIIDKLLSFLTAKNVLLIVIIWLIVMISVLLIWRSVKKKEPRKNKPEQELELYLTRVQHEDKNSQKINQSIEKNEADAESIKNESDKEKMNETKNKMETNTRNITLIINDIQNTLNNKLEVYEGILERTENDLLKIKKTL
ncbi:hypothetical protein COBT_000993 [Conglomerata obtusa]